MDLDKPIISPHDQPIVLLNRQLSYESTVGLVDEARKLNWRIYNVDVSNGNIPDNLSFIGGIVHGYPNDPLVAELKTRGLPVVYYNYIPFPEEFREVLVYPDNIRAGQLAAEHFASCGFKDLAYFQLATDKTLFYLSFESRARDLGCKIHLGTLDNFKITKHFHRTIRVPRY